MASEATTASQSGAVAKRRGSFLWVQGLACGLLLTFAAPMVLLLGVLAAPAIACALAGTGPGRGLARAVTLACAGASLHPAWHLWLSGGSWARALSSLADPLAILMAWGAGASAWALCQVLPVILQGVWDMREAARARAIEAELARFREDWTLKESPAA